MTTGLLELGEIMMTNSERQLEIVSRNISNASTPGYKAGVSFQTTLESASGVAPVVSSHTNLNQGALRSTGRTLDLAVAGAGFFRVAGEIGSFYCRGGHFERDRDGRIVDANGFALQGVDGGDIVAQSDAIEVLEDGAIVADGAVIGRIALFQPSENTALTALGGTLFTENADTMVEAGESGVRSGMLEAANTDMAAEMVRMMATLREAEAGARVVQAYDALIGQSISTFGRTPR